MDSINSREEHVVGKGVRKVAALAAAILVTGLALYFAQPHVPNVSASLDASARETAPSTTAGAVKAANDFLESLNDKLRTNASYEFASTKKPNWSNLPVSFVPRNGVKLGDLSKEQREKALNVIASVLSKEGYQKVIDIMDGDQKLADQGGGQGGGKGGPGGRGNGPMFGINLYYLAIFGTPSETKPWMVQFGGHHLGVNVTVYGKNFILTPTHTGTQPALFKRGDVEVRPLAKEIDSAFKLLDSLDQNQKKQAIIGERAQGELLFGPGRDNQKVAPKGLKGSDLTKDQKASLLKVVAAWVKIVENDAANVRLAEIEKKIDETYFAWSGSTTKGKPAYFRIQGPNIVIEYAPQGNTDHIHTVIRNPEDDYGVGTLKQ